MICAAPSSPGFPVSQSFEYAGVKLSLYNYHASCGELIYRDACVASGGLVNYVTELDDLEESRFDIVVAGASKGYGVIKRIDAESISVV